MLARNRAHMLDLEPSVSSSALDSSMNKNPNTAIINYLNKLMRVKYLTQNLVHGEYSINVHYYYC